ncbi:MULTISPECIES: hypothetical protein [unclassified Microcoleus]|uniref:hypothetical protein n=1 Tax=unclassified Microcoleus TaxID=2642155 RepID=UPI002FCEA2E0
MAKLIEAKSTVAIASNVWHEVLLGCYRMPDSMRRAIEAYLQEEVKRKLPILPYTKEVAEWFAFLTSKTHPDRSYTVLC